MADDIYRKSTTNSITPTQYQQIIDAMFSVTPRVPDITATKYSSLTQVCVIGSGVSNEKGFSEIDKWQDDVRQAIKAAIGKYPGEWGSCSKGEQVTTAKDKKSVGVGSA